MVHFIAFWQRSRLTRNDKVRTSPQPDCRKHNSCPFMSCCQKWMIYLYFRVCDGDGVSLRKLLFTIWQSKRAIKMRTFMRRSFSFHWQFYTHYSASASFHHYSKRNCDNEMYKSHAAAAAGADCCHHGRAPRRDEEEEEEEKSQTIRFYFHLVFLFFLFLETLANRSHFTVVRGEYNWIDRINKNNQRRETEREKIVNVSWIAIGNNELILSKRRKHEMNEINRCHCYRHSPHIWDVECECVSVCARASGKCWKTGKKVNLHKV